MSVSTKSKRDMFKELTLAVDKNLPTERELVLGDQRPFNVKNISNEDHLLSDLEKSESKTVNTTKSNGINAIDSKKANTNISLNNKSNDLEKSEGKIVDTTKTSDINAIDSKKANTNISLNNKSNDLEKSEGKIVNTTKSKTSQNNKSLNIGVQQALPTGILTTRKKSILATDESSKSNHLPPGKAHFTGNIDSDLHIRMKMFAFMNKILLIDVAESAMSVYMNILDTPNIISIVKEGQTLNEAILAVINEAVKKEFESN